MMVEKKRERRLKLLNLLAVSVMVLTVVMSMVSAPVSNAANPAIVQQTGGITALGTGAIPLTLGSVTVGDALVAFEYFSSSPLACSFPLAPTDSESNNWRSLGCMTDGALGAQAVFYVASAASTSSDSVTCNFAPAAATIEACYLFDVSNPAGSVTLIESGTGTGGYTAQVPVLAAAQSNSILLATVGFTGGCHGVTANGQTPSGIAPFVYNPASECSQGTISYGLTGSWVATVTQASYQWVMDPPSGCLSCSSPSPAWSLAVVQVPGPASITTSTSYSATIIGWLVPSSARFASSLALMFFPLAGLVAGTTLAKMFRIGGDIGVEFALSGMASGATLADLPTSASPVFQNLIPFAYIFTAWLLAFLYWWNS